MASVITGERTSGKILHGGRNDCVKLPGAPEFKNPPRPAGTVSAQLRDTRVRRKIKLTIEFVD
jgi:hypothetical protein